MTDTTLRSGLRFLLKGTDYTVCSSARGKGAIVNLKREDRQAQVQKIWIYPTKGVFTDPLQQEVILVPLNGVGEEIEGYESSFPTPLFTVRQAILMVVLYNGCQ